MDKTVTYGFNIPPFYFSFIRKILQGPGSFRSSQVPQASSLGLLLQRFSRCGVLFIYLPWRCCFSPLSGTREEWADDRVGCPELMTSPIFTSSFTFVLTWRLNAANERELILLRTTPFPKRKTAHLAGNALTEGRAAGHTWTLCLLDLGAEGEWWTQRKEGTKQSFRMSNYGVAWIPAESINSVLC